MNHSDVTRHVRPRSEAHGIPEERLRNLETGMLWLQVGSRARAAGFARACPVARGWHHALSGGRRRDTNVQRVAVQIVFLVEVAGKVYVLGLVECVGASSSFRAAATRCALCVGVCVTVQLQTQHATPLSAGGRENPLPSAPHRPTIGSSVSRSSISANSLVPTRGNEKAPERRRRRRRTSDRRKVSYSPSSALCVSRMCLPPGGV